MRRSKRTNTVANKLPLRSGQMDFEEIKKSLWHAFNVLDNSSKVNKSRVRVLTNNLGHAMGVIQAETIWDKIIEDIIDFDFFVNILCKDLLMDIGKASDPQIMRGQVDNLCWLLCEKAYLTRIKEGCSSDCDQEKKEEEVNQESEDVNKDEEEETNSTNKENEQTNADTDIDTNTNTKMPKNRREFSKSDLFKLWKMFNFLSERSDDGCMLTPMRIDVEEADRIACEICTTLGLPPPAIDSRSPRRLDDTSFLLDFCQFVNHVARLLCEEESEDVISQGISELYDQVISDVVRKGYLGKFGNKVTAWKDRWFVLTASGLKYYVSSEEKDYKGSIALCNGCFPQSFPDKLGGKLHRFKLHTPGRPYELCAPDLKSKNMWISDLRRVVNHLGCHKDSLQLVAWKQRKKEREDKRRRTAEEELQRCAEREALLERERQLEELKKQRELAQAEVEEREKLLELEKQKRLEEEKKRKEEMNEIMLQKRLEIDAERQRCLDNETRLKAEREELVKMNQEALEAERMEREAMIDRLKQEEAKVEEEKRVLKERLKELEEAKEMLENVVEEERALKRDEEIVRNLQAKILEEEFAKREELEHLRDEQRKQLVEEKLSRQELEDAHRQQEEELRMKREQLEALIAERHEADEKWKDASERLKQAETDRLHLEERLKLKEMSSSVSLAKPLSTPNPNPFVTHRGLGAFSEADFACDRKSPSSKMLDCNSNTHHSLDGKNGLEVDQRENGNGTLTSSTEDENNLCHMTTELLSVDTGEE